MLTRKVLVIEDDADTLRVLCLTLEKIGFPRHHIYTCRNVSECSDMPRVAVDIIITDLGLPDSPPEQTFPKIRLLFPDKPIIVISGIGEDNTVLQVMQQGAEDYLVKGRIDADTLERSIRYAIVRHKAAGDYRNLFAYSPIPMFVFAIEDFRFLEVNVAAQQQYGYSSAEMLKMTAEQIRPPAMVAEFRTRQNSIPGEFRNMGRSLHQHRDGTAFWVNIYAQGIEFEGKDAQLVIAVNVDDEVKKEKMLEVRVEEKEMILDSVTDGFLTIDRQHRVTYINRNSEKILHVSAADVLGKHIWDEVFPESKPLKFFSEYHKAITQQKSVHFEEYYPPLQVWLFVNAYPSAMGLTVFLIDITREKTLQEAIRLNEQNLRAILNNTDDLIWSVDRNYRFITANDSFRQVTQELFGASLSGAEMKEMSVYLQKEWTELYDRSFKGESFKIVRCSYVAGKEIFRETSFNPIRNESGAVIGVSCFSRDITEQQQHIRTIELQNEKFRQIAWMQGHEMRRPVANILGLIKLLNPADIKGEENHEIIQHLANSATELDQMIRDITQRTNNLTGK
jgi:PAS domain S-box-containing protein